MLDLIKMYKFLRNMARDMTEAELDGYNEIAPRAQQTEADPAEEEYVGSESFIYLNPDIVTEHKHYDIGIELDCSVYVV